MNCKHGEAIKRVSGSAWTDVEIGPMLRDDTTLHEKDSTYNAICKVCKERKPTTHTFTSVCTYMCV